MSRSRTAGPHNGIPHVFDILPPTGLDQSLLTPVLTGVLITAAATELFGWPFVGLVVPGYLSAVIIASPLSALMIVLEALLTYALSRVIGTWLPRLGAANVSFGRERFFLLVIMSVVVRLLVEGLALPWLAYRYDLTVAADLYSIGLVVVPLLANAWWNTGMLRGGVCSVVVTGATYLVVRFVWLAHTNLSLSQFELTYEAVALDFLGSPKAYLLLITGALLATRSNVAWGWDFNGILVPGLLTLAWYHPTKLAGTVVEALLVVAIAELATRTPPLSRQLIEGPRRVVLLFVIGFTLKWGAGWAGVSFAPGMRVTDLFGFGYVLPTLLAVKMWQKRSAARVLVPTLATTLVAFVLGNSVATPSG